MFFVADGVTSALSAIHLTRSFGPRLAVDNVSFDRSVLFIIRHVAEALRRREGVDAEALL